MATSFVGSFNTRIAQEVSEEELFVQNCKDQLSKALALAQPPTDDTPLPKLIEQTQIVCSQYLSNTTHPTHTPPQQPRDRTQEYWWRCSPEFL